MFEILLLANYEYLFENIRRTSAAVTCIQLKGKLKKLGSKLETPVGYVLDYHHPTVPGLQYSCQGFGTGLFSAVKLPGQMVQTSKFFKNPEILYGESDVRGGERQRRSRWSQPALLLGMPLSYTVGGAFRG